MKTKHPFALIGDIRWLLVDACSGKDMSQSGKHANDTLHENKRERRRGAAGRAAALRRAPSDSDCSGETASLSADSGDRIVKPQVAPPRSGKSRSRRRGSEWEVLEGLKDGQRFEKRPDVFNGYLHKKRKWPLKGWHKRFFVVDGGILVYARSPADVARGRLHGSVDVGLSVISAKARRRRIDIDADEFIYHLRAKTPDVFRTWLSVLKAHRLYRQHLLTFGARESAPKINAPLDDPAATDTSSRVYDTSKSTSDVTEFNASMRLTEFNSKTLNGSIPIEFDPMKDLKTFTNDDHIVKVYSMPKSNTENGTDIVSDKKLGANNKPRYKERDSVCLKSVDTKALIHLRQTNKIVNAVVNKQNMQCYFFRKKCQNNSVMRRSRKSTNLVKYRNECEEPKLRRPLGNYMLLGEQTSERKRDGANRPEILDKRNEIRVNTTDSKHNKIVDRLVDFVFKDTGKERDLRTNISKIIKEVLEKDCDKTKYPVKAMFRTLIEFWLDSVDVKQCKETIKISKSTNTKSKSSTRDVNLSGIGIGYKSHATQFGFGDLVHEFKSNKFSRKGANEKNISPVFHSPIRDTDSYEKERRIQELERPLNNTIYVCDTVRSKSRERDIKITKTLIDNLNNKTNLSDYNDTSNSSNEIPKIQYTIKKLISEASVPAEIAEDFLNAYLGVLEDSLNTTDSSINFSVSETAPACDVLTEEVVKKVSKSISACEMSPANRVSNLEGNNSSHYVKDVLNRVAMIFSKQKENEREWSSKDKETDEKQEVLQDTMKELARENLCKTVNEQSVVIDLSKYDLDQILTSTDSDKAADVTITIKLKSKNIESTRRHLSLRFSNDKKYKNDKLNSKTNNGSSEMFREFNRNNSNRYINEPVVHLEDGKRIYSSDATSKAYLSGHSERSFCMTSDKRKNIESNAEINRSYNETPCYMMSDIPKNYKKLKTSDHRCENDVSKSNDYSSEIIQNCVNLEKTNKSVVNEEFVLLILGDLCKLTQGLPSLHKEIHGIHSKLKNKYYETIQNDITTELSFLDKIYKENNFDTKQGIFHLNTTNNISNCFGKINQSLNTVPNMSIQFGHVTEKIPDIVPIDNKHSKASNCDNEKATNIPINLNIYKVNNLKSNEIETGESLFKRTQTKTQHNKNVISEFIETTDRCTSNVKINTENEFSKTGDINKYDRIETVNSKMRNEKGKLNKMKKKYPDSDLKVYKIYYSKNYNTKGSSSTTDLNFNKKDSDDLKTIYRCPSEPSLISG
ncbi:putative uncharacterized protein DDB_G0282133 isoform X1 [Bombyx mori]|uniref:PH domain-containing protein n=2 Tax=Bombyx mori TaxID=7091 RepID=A0A8R2M4M1_BOMMO|nr:putative uncharacterized protein DDB_G0282133 isoform X1 [Bombyx mori]